MTTDQTTHQQLQATLNEWQPEKTWTDPTGHVTITAHRKHRNFWTVAVDGHTEQFAHTAGSAALAYREYQHQTKCQVLACPTCKAAPGEPCSIKRGAPLRYTHLARQDRHGRQLRAAAGNAE